MVWHGIVWFGTAWAAVMLCYVCSHGNSRLPYLGFLHPGQEASIDLGRYSRTPTLAALNPGLEPTSHHPRLLEFVGSVQRDPIVSIPYTGCRIGPVLYIPGRSGGLRDMACCRVPFSMVEYAVCRVY